MVVEFGSIENAYAHLEEVKPNKARESLRAHYDLASLSKTLATINTDSPLAFSFEEARLENLYTGEAYELCKRLEFKNLLGRFDAQAATEKLLEQEFLPAAICQEQRHFLKRHLHSRQLVSHLWRIRTGCMESGQLSAGRKSIIFRWRAF